MAGLFEFFAFRLQFAARDSIYFPLGKPGNLLRGAFGKIFRRIACTPECEGVRSCEIRHTCPYARIFEPSAAGRGPSGLADLPRPFVFRAHHLDGRTVEAGEHFHFDLHLFDLRDPGLAYFVLAFTELTREGLGPGRGRAELLRVDQIDVSGSARLQVYQGGNLLPGEMPPPISLDLSPEPKLVHHVWIRFVTPTELKSGARVTEKPDFGVLFARIRDRLSTLCALYGPGPLEIDFRGMGERAENVRMPRCELRRVEAARRSSRTGQTHPLGGFTGEAEYEGDLAEFLPYLRAAYWTGVGRQTVWGKGVLETSA